MVFLGAEEQDVVTKPRLTNYLLIVQLAVSALVRCSVC